MEDEIAIRVHAEQILFDVVMPNALTKADFIKKFNELVYYGKKLGIIDRIACKNDKPGHIIINVDRKQQKEFCSFIKNYCRENNLLFKNT